MMTETGPQVPEFIDEVNDSRGEATNTCRRDSIEKTTTQLVRDYDLIALEDLKIKDMVRSPRGTIENPGKNVSQKRGLNRAILSQSWSLFRKRLEDEASSATSLVEIIPINPKSTSQTCSQCGNTRSKNRNNQAVFACITCEHEANADINAARNILAAGLGPLWGLQDAEGHCTQSLFGLHTATR